MTSTEINLNVSHCNDCGQDVDLLHTCSIEDDSALLAALLKSPDFVPLTFPQDLTNEEFRAVHGEPCEHSHGDHIDYQVGVTTIWVYECRDCGLVL